MNYLFCGISYQTSNKPYLHLHIVEDYIPQTWNYRLIPIRRINSKYYSITSISNRTEVAYA